MESGIPGPGGVLDPDGAMDRMRAWHGRIDKLAADTKVMSDRLQQLRVTLVSDNGLAEVTVDSTGALLDLRLGRQVQRVQPELTAQTIMDTIRLAKAQRPSCRSRSSPRPWARSRRRPGRSPSGWAGSCGPIPIPGRTPRRRPAATAGRARERRQRLGRRHRADPRPRRTDRGAALRLRRRAQREHPHQPERPGVRPALRLDLRDPGDPSPAPRRTRRLSRREPAAGGGAAARDRRQL